MRDRTYWQARGLNGAECIARCQAGAQTHVRVVLQLVPYSVPRIVGKHPANVLMQRGASAGYQCALFTEAWDAQGAQAEVERRRRKRTIRRTHCAYGKYHGPIVPRAVRRHCYRNFSFRSCCRYYSSWTGVHRFVVVHVVTGLSWLII